MKLGRLREAVGGRGGCPGCSEGDWRFSHSNDLYSHLHF